MTSERIDLEVLAEYVGSDPQHLLRFVQLALSSLDEALAPLDGAIAQRALATLENCGHRAKSTALHIGAQDFANTCQALETTAHAGQTGQALALARQLQARLQPLKNALLDSAAERLVRRAD